MDDPPLDRPLALLLPMTRQSPLPYVRGPVPVLRPLAAVSGFLPHVQRSCALSPYVVPACRASVGSRAARGPFGPYGPDGRSGGTLGRMIVVRHDLDQYHGLDIAFTR